MFLKIVIVAAFSLHGFADHPLIDRLEKDIDYLDSKTAENDSLDDHELGVIPKEFERRDQKMGSIEISNEK